MGHNRDSGKASRANRARKHNANHVRVPVEIDGQKLQMKALRPKARRELADKTKQEMQDRIDGVYEPCLLGGTSTESQ
jgi:hypothetical protein